MDDMPELVAPSGQPNGSSPTDLALGLSLALSLGRIPVRTLASPVAQDGNGIDANGNNESNPPATIPDPAPNGSTGD